MDVVIDMRARPGPTEWLAHWLEDRAFDMERSPDGVGHRFVRGAKGDRALVVFDVLGPEGLSAPLYTLRPYRTLGAPRSTRALARAELVAVTVSGAAGTTETTGQVRRLPLFSAFICKAAATRIVCRDDPERAGRTRPWPCRWSRTLGRCLQCSTRKDKQRLRFLRPLLGPGHVGWRPLSPEHRELGRSALELLLGD
jgi:hypothetical protein